MHLKAAIPLAFACVLACLPGISRGQCGPGPHWIDACPGGQDFFPNAQATIGLDLPADGNLDGLVDMTYTLTGPATVQRSQSRDDSLHFPGIRSLDGHLDVIDTEIVSMVLTGGGVTVIAGAGQGVGPGGGGLAPTLGNIAEQWADNSLGDSFFDVFLEVDLGGGTFAYNLLPARMEAVLDRVPIDATYLYTGLLTLPGALAPVGQLVTAELILPEPTTMALLALGAAPVALLRRRRRR